MRVGIIGLGWVGASVAISTLHRGIARELWLDDVREGLAEAEAADLAHGASFYAPCDVRRASVEQMAEGCDAVVIAAGRGALPGQSRLDALGVTAGIARELGARLRGARGVVVVVTNPVDVMTELVVEASGLPHERVIGTGTMLDTARLRHVLSQRLRIDERSIHAQVLGEHGDSSVLAWSSATVGGVPLRTLPGWRSESEPVIAHEVRRAAYEIIAKKGATNHAIGLVTASLLQCVLRGERRVLTVSRVHGPGGPLTAWLGDAPVALSVPTVVDRQGAVEVLPPALDDGERAALRRSAEVLREARATVEP
jgi:L-lactate dehydrogenase